MTSYFEVLRRDGPARLGRLIIERDISTPALLTSNDYLSAGSILGYRSPEEAAAAFESMKGGKKLVVMPYSPAPPGWPSPLLLPEMDSEGPLGMVVHPLSWGVPRDADVYIMEQASALRRPKELVSAVVQVRNRIPPDAALYAPALATPANLAFLLYIGIDLVDSVKVEADGYMGLYHTADGCWPIGKLDPLPCLCKHCLAMSGRRDPELAAAHNLLTLEEGLLTARQMIRSGTLREHVEKQVRVSPALTAALRLLDGEHSYLEARTPLFRHSVLYANSAESLKRVEVTRFAQRVLERYRALESDVLLLLPCSARKPYSTSRSHQLFLQAVGSLRRHLHQLILTSPLALVPRELEEVYPAASYDLPVTGRWDLEERHWLLGCLEAYLEKNRYARIVAHLEGELEETVRAWGLDAVYTGGGTREEDGRRLSSAVQEACQGSRRLEDFRLQRFRALADYYFGSGAGDALLCGAVRCSGRELQDEEKKALAMLTANGTIALSLKGARMLERLGSYIVTMGDFVPRGSLLAPGVLDADEQIRPGDEVIVRGEKAFGVGRARMSGWEMVRSKRGVAVELKSVAAE